MKKSFNIGRISLERGKTVQTIARFFDINQKITNKTRIFMHFVPRNRQKPLSLQAVNKYQ